MNDYFREHVALYTLGPQGRPPCPYTPEHAHSLAIHSPLHAHTRTRAASAAPPKKAFVLSGLGSQAGVHPAQALPRRERQRGR